MSHALRIGTAGFAVGAVGTALVGLALYGIGLIGFPGRQEPVSPDWDALINEAIDRGDYRCKDDAVAIVGGYEVWASHKSLAYGSPYRSILLVMPTEDTITRLYEALGDCSQQSAPEASVP